MQRIAATGCGAMRPTICGGMGAGASTTTGAAAVSSSAAVSVRRGLRATHGAAPVLRVKRRDSLAIGLLHRVMARRQVFGGQMSSRDDAGGNARSA